MIMKRKIDATEDDYDVVITPRSPKSYKTVHTSAAEPLPLTRRNLAELSSKDSTNSISSQSMASSGSRRSSVAITDEERSLAVIKIWGISIHDGQSSLTTPLERLLEAVTEPRESIEVTPNSRKTSALQALFDELPEADMISHLNRHLFYTPSAIPGDEGEPDVWISVDRQWLINTPKPLGVPEKVLQDTIKENGTLPKPKPDFTHGYPDTAFTESQLNRLISLPAHTKVLPGKPWFPWLIVEVKSKQPIAEAQRQVSRLRVRLWGIDRYANEHLTGVPRCSCCYRGVSQHTSRPDRERASIRNDVDVLHLHRSEYISASPALALHPPEQSTLGVARVLLWLFEEGRGCFSVARHDLSYPTLGTSNALRGCKACTGQGHTVD